jgi:hypothetical protein
VLAQAAAQPGPDLAQQPVPGAVAEAVVDHLEVVQVDEEHGQAAAVAARPGQRVPDPVVEQGPVGQVGEAVVEGQVLELGGQGELQLDHAGVLDPVADQVGDLQAEVGPADPGAAGHLDGGPVPAGLDRELDRAGDPVEAEGAGEPQPDHRSLTTLAPVTSPSGTGPMALLRVRPRRGSGPVGAIRDF